MDIYTIRREWWTASEVKAYLNISQTVLSDLPKRKLLSPVKIRGRNFYNPDQVRRLKILRARQQQIRDTWWSTKEAAAYLQVSPVTILNLRYAPHIMAYDLGGPRGWYFHPESIKRLSTRQAAAMERATEVLQDVLQQYCTTHGVQWTHPDLQQMEWSRISIHLSQKVFDALQAYAFINESTFAGLLQTILEHFCHHLFPYMKRIKRIPTPTELPFLSAPSSPARPPSAIHIPKQLRDPLDPF